MQKKLIAVAVAGALGAPAVALAQNATVNMYGTMYFEYSSVDQGRTQGTTTNIPAGTNPGNEIVRTDLLQNPGSNIGFRGEEKLGSGLSAWFQCESSADYRGTGTSGFCSRNSAIGLKGGFGNVFAGIWDTPFKRVTSDMLGAAKAGGDTGIYGNANIVFGGSRGTNTTSGAGANQAAFRRRQTNLITYDTPNFGGFSASGAFTTGNPSTAALEGSSGNKPRIWSLSAQYKNGPLNIYGAYERHKDITGTTLAGNGNGLGGITPNPLRPGSDTGWVVGGSYVFSNNLKLGGLYTRQRWEQGANSIVPFGPIDARVNAYYLALDWMISGPHGVRASWGSARDVTGTFIPLAGNPVFAGANPGVVGAPPVIRPGIGSGTGANIWQIKYVHVLSKRTQATIGYVRLDNKQYANYNLTGTSANGTGQDQQAVALTLYHTF